MFNLFRSGRDVAVNLTEPTVIIALPLSKLTALANVVNTAEAERSDLKARTVTEAHEAFDAIADVLDVAHGGDHWIEEA